MAFLYKKKLNLGGFECVLLETKIQELNVVLNSRGKGAEAYPGAFNISVAVSRHSNSVLSRLVRQDTELLPLQI